MLFATDPEMPINFWSSLADKGLSIAFLTAAVYFMGKWFLSAQAAKDTLYAQRIQELSTEMVSMRERMRATEIEMVECKRDRDALKERIDLLSPRPTA